MEELQIRLNSQNRTQKSIILSWIFGYVTLGIWRSCQIIVLWNPLRYCFKKESLNLDLFWGGHGKLKVFSDLKIWVEKTLQRNDSLTCISPKIWRSIPNKDCRRNFPRFEKKFLIWSSLGGFMAVRRGGRSRWFKHDFKRF